MQNPIIKNRQYLSFLYKWAIRKTVLLFCLFIVSQTFAQTHSAVVSPGVFYTRYGKTAVGYTNAMIPYVSVTAGKYYTELRYNYDYDHTLGVYAGKTFYLDKDSSQSLIPQVGWLAGGINAGSVQAYYIVDTKQISVEFDNQFSFRFNNQKNIYYNWLSAAYNFSSSFSSGFATQTYVGPGGNFNDNGLFATFTKAGYVFTIYDFDAYQWHRHYVAVELLTDINFRRRKR